MRTIFSLAEKGRASYFDIKKREDQYIFLIMLPNVGGVRPICKSEKNHWVKPNMKGHCEVACRDQHKDRLE